MWNITSAQSYTLWFLIWSTEVVCPGSEGEWSGKNALTMFGISEGERGK